MNRIAALTVIMLAGALSAAWAFTVPIFQAPDEPAHFDYAMSIEGAGRLIQLADGRRDWIVTPATRYLMHAADFDRIVGHSSMRVPHGYGTGAYFARLDAHAPDPRAALAPAGRISYIAALYPFGFYALEALWMHAAAAVTGSLAATFFAARLLCVLLTMIALYFSYRTALNLGVPPWTSVALTAAVGFFPLTSLVSSYVQPDNLAYASLAAALFFTTQLRDRAITFGVLTGIGLSLGLLAVTKYQFFVSAAIPIALYCAVRIARAHFGAAARALAAAILLMPAVVLLAVQHFAVNRAAPGAPAPVAIGIEPLRAATAAGFVPALHYVAATSLAAFVDFFVWGGCVATFWQTIGWVDTPIVIGNPEIQILIRYGIAVIAIALIALLATRFARNAVRLGVAALRGHGAAALRAIARDPVLNSYLCFLAIMLALYVVSNNGFGAEGRHWYPYIFAAFLCFAWYAPRALTRHYRAVSAALTCALLAYSVTAAAYALGALHARYYGPAGDGYAVLDPTPAQIAPAHLGMLWPVATAAYHASTGQVDFAYPRGTRLVVIGAAISARNTRPPLAVAIELDGRAALPVIANQYAFMIAEAMRSIPEGYRAFDAQINTLPLREGPHRVAAYALLGSARRFAVIPPARVFFVTASGGRFSHEFVRSIARAPDVAGTLGSVGKCRSDVVLMRGNVATQGLSYSAVWLMVDDRPFPARYEPSRGTFAATIPTESLNSGAQRVTAYAITGSGEPRRLRQNATIDVVTPHGAPAFLSNPPAACSDPLAQLAS